MSAETALKIPVPLQIIPAPDNLFAVIAREDGKGVVFEPVVALGNYEVDPDPDQPLRVVSGVTAGTRMHPADWRLHFLGYYKGDPKDVSDDKWIEAAKVKIAEIKAAKEKAAQSKIIIAQAPGAPNAGAFGVEK